jgi:lipopolysaccharide export system permease protein
MKTLRRYVVREILLATFLVLLAVLMLFAFFDFVEEIRDLGRGEYRMRHVVRHVLLSVPNHVYEIFPIAALMGTLFALAQLVASSEYTVMRTAGMSLARMLLAILSAGAFLGVLTFVFGEYVGPHAEQWAVQLRSRAISGVIAQEFRSGLWLKDDARFINVREITADGALHGVRVYEFDGQARLVSVSEAKKGVYDADRRWRMSEVVKTQFTEVRTESVRLAQEVWPLVLEPRLLSVLTIQPAQMSVGSLAGYIQHLRENKQKSLRYEIAMWSKITYPLAVCAMMMLALPFAYFQRRQGGVGGRLFAGIMLGLLFYFLNQLSAHLGLLNEWPAQASALMPTAAMLLLAFGMLWWQERR